MSLWRGAQSSTGAQAAYRAPKLHLKRLEALCGNACTLAPWFGTVLRTPELRVGCMLLQTKMYRAVRRPFAAELARGRCKEKGMSTTWWCTR